MKKLLKICMVASIVLMVSSCRSVEKRDALGSTSLDASRPVVEEDETAEQKPDPFSLILSVTGEAGIINSQGIDAYTDFYAQYDAGSFGIDVKGRLPLTQP